MDEKQNMKINADALLYSMSEDVAKMSREKAILHSQLFECRQIIKQLNEEINKLKKTKQ